MTHVPVLACANICMCVVLLPIDQQNGAAVPNWSATVRHSSELAIGQAGFTTGQAGIPTRQAGSLAASGSPPGCCHAALMLNSSTGCGLRLAVL